MGQAEVFEFLLNHSHRWYTIEEISQNTDLSKSAVNRSLNKLVRQGVTEKRRDPDGNYKFYYRFKH